MRGQVRRFQARRSTLVALSGIGLMALAFALTLAHVAGNVVPTVMGVVGFVLLNAGLAIGTTLIFDNLRYSRGQPYYDPDEENDE